MSSLLDEQVQQQLNLNSNKTIEEEPFPVKTSVFRDDVDDAESPVETVLSQFGDRIQLTVTDLGKPGAFYEVRRSVNPLGSRVSAAGGAGDQHRRSLVHIRHVFGKHHELLELAARSLAELFFYDRQQDKDETRPILISLAFKGQLTPAKIQQITQLVKKNIA